MAHVCEFCNANFPQKRNLDRHILQKSCNAYPFPSKLSDTNVVGLAVFRGVNTHELKFHVCQQFGLAKAKFFPLRFAPQRKTSLRAAELDNWFPSHEDSIRVLQKVLSGVADSVLLPKELTLEVDGTVMTIRDSLYPEDNEMFSVEDLNTHVRVSLKGNPAQNPRVENPSDAQPMDVDVPAAAALPVAQAAVPQRAGEYIDPYEPSEIDNSLKNRKITKPYHGYIITRRNDLAHLDLRTEGRYPSGPVSGRYNGMGLLRCTQYNFPYKQAKKTLQYANSRYHQFTNLLHYPALIPDDGGTFKYLTGQSWDNYIYHKRNFAAPVKRERVFDHNSKVMPYLIKMRHGLPDRLLGVFFGVSDTEINRIFWEHSLLQYLKDPIIPHRNSAVHPNLPSPVDVLKQHVVKDEYLLGVFGNAILPGHQLVINSYDHTYFYSPKFGNINDQKRCYCQHKGRHCLKCGLLVSYDGKILYYTPPTGSLNPAHADGNTTSHTLEWESSGQIEPRLSTLFKPPLDSNLTVITCFDYGYTKGARGGDAEDDLNLLKFYTDDGLRQDNAKFLTVFGPGSNLLDRNFNYTEPDTVPLFDINGTKRFKFTTTEASLTRLMTLIRWVVETTNAGVKNFKFLDARIMNTKFFDSLDTLGRELLEILDGCPDSVKQISKLEVLVHNALCMYQRNHAPFVRRMYVPYGLTPRQFGENFFTRVFLKNSLCRFERVQWTGNLHVKPRSAKGNPWKSCNYDDAVLGFPDIVLDHLIFLTHGHYQISNIDKYITHVRFNEVYKQFENDPELVEDIDFTDYDELMSGLPETLKVYYYDQEEAPANWCGVNYGPWCPRRLVMVVMPSRHTTQSHVTVISFLPEGSIHRPEFHRLGFQEELSSILEYCCSCRIGSRLAGCCSHVASVIALLGKYASDETEFRSRYSKKHYFDPQQPESLNQSLHLKKDVDDIANSSDSDSSDSDVENLQDLL